MKLPWAWSRGLHHPERRAQCGAQTHTHSSHTHCSLAALRGRWVSKLFRVSRATGLELAWPGAGARKHPLLPEVWMPALSGLPFPGPDQPLRPLSA